MFKQNFRKFQNWAENSRKFWISMISPQFNWIRNEFTHSILFLSLYSWCCFLIILNTFKKQNSIVDCDPVHRAMDQLIDEYVSTTSKSNEMKPEIRLKIGEVLTRAVRNLGELVPHYGPKLLGAFLVGAKHSDELVRASSLSNLGETCRLLNYSIRASLNEIIACLSSFIDSTDESVSVRRAAALVLKMLVEGLRADTFVEVLGSSVTSLYKLLVRVKSNSREDDVVRSNCECTCERINDMVKKSMFPSSSTKNLVKEIKILAPWEILNVLFKLTRVNRKFDAIIKICEFLPHTKKWCFFELFKFLSKQKNLPRKEIRILDFYSLCEIFVFDNNCPFCK